MVVVLGDMGGGDTGSLPEYILNTYASISYFPHTDPHISNHVFHR